MQADASFEEEGEVTRLILTFKGLYLKRLFERIKRMGKHPDETTAITSALRHYEKALIEKQKGHAVVVLDKEGKTILRLL